MQGVLPWPQPPPLQPRRLTLALLLLPCQLGLAVHLAALEAPPWLLLHQPQLLQPFLWPCQPKGGGLCRSCCHRALPPGGSCHLMGQSAARCHHRCKEQAHKRWTCLVGCVVVHATSLEGECNCDLLLSVSVIVNDPHLMEIGWDCARCTRVLGPGPASSC